MDNELKQETQVKGEDVMKIVKQPLFIAGAAAIVLSIVIAIVGSVINPAQPAVIGKYVKAMENQDAKLLSECFSPTAGVDSNQLAMALGVFKLGLESEQITGKVEMEYLVGDEIVDTLEDGREITRVPMLMVIKSNGQVKLVKFDTQSIIEIDGKEYLYTGKE